MFVRVQDLGQVGRHRVGILGDVDLRGRVPEVSSACPLQANADAKQEVPAGGTPGRPLPSPALLWRWREPRRSSRSTCGGEQSHWAALASANGRRRRRRRSHRSSILVVARSSFSRICSSCASSSQRPPQPSTRARSFPVPSGSTPSWHCGERRPRLQPRLPANANANSPASHLLVEAELVQLRQHPAHAAVSPAHQDPESHELLEKPESGGAGGGRCD